MHLVLHFIETLFESLLCKSSVAHLWQNLSKFIALLNWIQNFDTSYFCRAFLSSRGTTYELQC